MTDCCDHRFTYAGLRFAHGSCPRPGTGATTTYYGHAYFCDRCLEPRIESADAGDRNSYQPILDGAVPASDRERALLVPDGDKPWSYR